MGTFWEAIAWPAGMLGVFLAIVLALIVLAIVVSWVTLPFALWSIMQTLENITVQLAIIAEHVKRLRGEPHESHEGWDEDLEDLGSDDE